MTEDPLGWLKGHKNLGVILREEAWDLVKTSPAQAWARRAEQWAREVKAKVGGWSKVDLLDLEVLDEIPFLTLRTDHVWYEARPTPGIITTSTGPGRPGNNPLSRHVALVKKTKAIIKRWEVNPPRKHKYQLWCEEIQDRTANGASGTIRDAAVFIGKRDSIPWETIEHGARDYLRWPKRFAPK